MRIDMGFTLEEVREHWDRVACVYDSNNRNKPNPHHWRFIEGIKHLKPTKKKVVVVSCFSRTGDAVPYIRSMIPNAIIHHFEVSENMASIAKKKYPDEVFRLTDLDVLDLESDCVDYVMSHETLEHTPNPPALIKEFYRVLKPGGRLILSLPPRIADFHQLVYETLVGGHGDGPRKGIPSWVVKRMLREAGFTLVKHKGILLFPFGAKWFIDLGNKLATIPLLKEFGIMQYYICEK